MRVTGFSSPFTGTNPSSLNPIHGTNSAGRIEFNQNLVQGSSSAGGRIESRLSIVNGSLSAGGRIELVESAINGSVSAGGRLEVTSSLITGNASAGGRIEIRQAEVKGTLSTGSSAEIKASKIDAVSVFSIDGDKIVDSEIGSLTAHNERLILSDSSVRDINLQLGGSNTNVVITGSSSSVTITGGNITIGNGNITIGNGGGGFFKNFFNKATSSGSNSHIQVGVGGTSVVNGYVVKGLASQTTVVTPDSTVYINGLKQSGPGPETYADYKTQHQDAPKISGPGWTDGKAVIKNAAKPQGPTQFLILEARSVVSGRVVFAGGNGKIVVRQGSEFTGTVEGGVVERE